MDPLYACHLLEEWFGVVAGTGADEVFIASLCRQRLLTFLEQFSSSAHVYRTTHSATSDRQCLTLTVPRSYVTKRRRSLAQGRCKMES